MSEKTYQVGGMDCANCAREVEEGVRKLDGVNAVRVDFFTSKMVLSGDVPYRTLQKRLEALGKTLITEEAAPVPSSRKGLAGFWDYLQTRLDSQLALAGGVWVLFTLVLSILLPLPESLVGLMYTLGMVVTLLPIARSGVRTLFINREFNINLLMTIAAVGAIVIGEYLESATVIFLFAISEALEGYTTDRARDSIRSLMSLKPTHAHRLDGAAEVIVPVQQLQIDDVILVKPGENIPMDGVIIAGSSDINQAPITGESMPVYKTNGDAVFAGSLNGNGALKLRITHLAADNTLSRIIQLVEEAQSVRAPSQRLIDRFAHYYTPAVVVLAALVAILPPLLFNAPFYDTVEGHGWLYRALSMLVIACPCALVISTPVTVISAITAAARRGVLIKGGVHLEALGMIKSFAFDKTGTLTKGKPVVIQSRSIDCQTGLVCPDCDDVLALAAAVERRSTHPLAQAVVQAAEKRQLLNTYAAAEDVEVLAGRGMQGMIGDKLVTVGSHQLFDSQHPHHQTLCDMVAEAESSGYTTMMLCDGDRVRGFISVADDVREDSHSVIETLNRLGGQTVMLTGDNPVVAQSVGRKIGVGDIRAGLLPSAKVDAVRDLIVQHGHVAMIGDGVNDTPALAAATVGIAMGGAGSAQALETADIVLMADDLKQLPFAVQLSRFARALIRQNVTISFGIKFVFLMLALFGATSLWAAVLADMGTSLLVTFNGMRPLRYDPDLKP
jgi:Zn2+/Cd2+-exporting ATPase